jgi:hypothetical protein
VVKHPQFFKGDYMKKVSKYIEVDPAENGYIIKVEYYEWLDSITDFVKHHKRWVAETEKKKDEILKTLV